MGKLAAFFSTQKIELSPQQSRHMLALDQELAALERKVRASDNENQQLRESVDRLVGEVDRLRKVILDWVGQSVK